MQESKLFKELDQLVQLHESGEDFVQYIKSKKPQFKLRYTRSNMKLHLPQPEAQTSHYMDSFNKQADDTTLKERSLSNERNKQQKAAMSEAEEHVYKMLQDKYNHILLRLQDLVN